MIIAELIPSMPGPSGPSENWQPGERMLLNFHNCSAQQKTHAGASNRLAASFEAQKCACA